MPSHYLRLISAALFFALLIFCVFIYSGPAKEELSYGSSSKAPRSHSNAPESNEVYWSKFIAETLHGAAEEPIRDANGRGRCDVYLKERALAIEVEWTVPSKTPEARDQALRYAKALQAKPAVIFLLGRGDLKKEIAIVSTFRYLNQEIINKKNVITVNINKDTKSIIEKLNKDIEKALNGISDNR